MSTKKIILTLAILICSIPIVLILFATGKEITDLFVAHDKVNALRLEAEKGADSKLNDVTRYLNQKNLVGEKIASSKVDVCYLNHEDQGWVASNWYQDCYIRYTQGYVTQSTKVEVLRDVLKNSKGSTYFGEINQYAITGSGTDCDLFEKDYKSTLIYLPAGSLKNDFECQIPNPIQGTFTVRGPIILDRKLSARAYRTFDVDEISRENDQLWIQFDEYYYHEDLGCQVLSIFCSSPRAGPVHPKL